MILLDTIEKDATDAVKEIETVFSDDVLPWLKVTFKGAVDAEVKVLLPYATRAAGAMAGALATSKGKLVDFAAIAAQVLTGTAAAAEADSVIAIGDSLLASVVSAISVHTAAIQLGGAPPPALPDPAPVVQQ